MKFNFLTAFVLLLTGTVFAQDSVSTATVSVKYVEQVSGLAGKLDQKLDKQTSKALRQLEKQEARIRQKLAKTDSSKAAQLASNAKQQYHSLQQKLETPTGKLQQYIPSLDSLGSSLQFLQQHPELLSKAKEAREKLSDAVSKLKGMEGKLQKAEDVKQFLKERREYLQQQLGNMGFAKEFKKLNKQVYYYSEQLQEYKSLLKDHQKAGKKALELLSKTKLFKDFMRKNSVLAGLFRMPGDPDDPATAAVSLAGLQTRAQVNGLIQQQLAAGGPNAQAQFSQNLQDAQSQLNGLKDQFFKNPPGASGETAEGFRPNNQKTKSFLQRLELGTNVQSQRSNSYFPVTSDIGLSLGYKLNDKSIIGIGTSYKLGWGQNIRNINITHQGVSARSFVDWKLKGSFWVSGGYEMNYRSGFNSVQQLQNIKGWNQSGLLGMSKVVSLKAKFFKQTKLQLLWDFLSYQQVPRTQPVLFRVGYNF
jgi:hypothetical protein